MKKKISSKKAPAAIGPYSQGIETEHLIFLSGQIPLDPETMKLVEGDENQIRQVFKNIDALCTEANLNMDHIVKLNVSLHDLSLFSLVNEIMKELFTEPPLTKKLLSEDQEPNAKAGSMMGLKVINSL